MPEFIRRPYKVKAKKAKRPAIIHTLEGDMHADKGDWIVEGKRGEHWPVKPGIFEESYRPVQKKKERCPEGYYRDKDGKCRPKQNYGGGYVVVQSPTKPDNGDDTDGPTNGDPGTSTNGSMNKDSEVHEISPDIYTCTLDEILPNPLNRKLDEDKVEEIKDKIESTRLIKPLVITEVTTDDGKELMLTDGHHRYQALKELRFTNAPVIVADERGTHTADGVDLQEVHKNISLIRNLVSKLNMLKADFEESKHPRSEDGKFTSGEGSPAGKQADREARTLPYKPFNPSKDDKPEKSELRAALKDQDNRVFDGPMEEGHAGIYEGYFDEFIDPEALEDGFIDRKGNFYTRDQVHDLFSHWTTEDLLGKVMKIHELRDLVAKLNRMRKEGISEVSVPGLSLTRQDLGVRRKPKTKKNYPYNVRMEEDQSADLNVPIPKNPNKEINNLEIR